MIKNGLKKYFVVFFLLVTSVLFGAIDKDYLWLKLQSGIDKFQKKQYGDAMVLFSECEILDASNGDVAYWIGRVYEVEGDYELAKLQYQKAINYYQFQEPFTIDQIFESSLHLADTYLHLGDRTNYISLLDSLSSKNAKKSLSERDKDHQAILSLFNKSGLNKVLELYRLDNNLDMELFSRKGAYFKSIGDIDQSKKYFLLSIVTSLSTILNECESHDIAFIFTNQDNANQSSNEKITKDMSVSSLTTTHYGDIAKLLSNVSNNTMIRDYISKSNLMENIYTLAVLLKQQKNSQAAIDILWIPITYPHNAHISKNANRLFLEISSGR